MAFDKWLRRIEAKLDALLEAQKLNPDDIEAPKVSSIPPLQLTEADKQAIANAPDTPSAPDVDATDGPRVDALNAPLTPAVDDKPKKGKSAQRVNWNS